MRKISVLLILVAAGLITGCSKYGFVNLNYPLNPNVILPGNIKNVAMVNRSLTNQTTQKNKVVESIITGEIAGSDKLASDECLKTVFDKLNGNHGFTIVIPQQTRLYGTGTRETPELLSWQQVRNICDSSKADALLVLENFDANTDLIVSTVAKQVANIMNGGTPKPVLPTQVQMNVYSYWRLYDPSTNSIIDQYRSNINGTFNCAPNSTLPPADALYGMASQAGQDYSLRLLPSYYVVRRDLYKRGTGASKQQFLAAFRQTEVANWQEAINIWTAVVQNASPENAGRACLNIAVAYEVLGNTELALQWAKKSYTDFNNKLGKDYSNILINRRSIEY